MLIARYATGSDVGYGVVLGIGPDGEPAPGAAVQPVSGHPFGPMAPAGDPVPLPAVRLLAPVLPSKVVAVGRNYAEHAAESGHEVPAEPMLFLKPSTAVIGPRATILLPAQSALVEHEAELAVVIGRLCREVAAERAGEVILGYTCANDVTARDLQRRDGQWGRAKGFDTFCPLGPWIATDVDPADLAVRCTVDGAERQSGRTRDLVHGVGALVEFVSTVMTLLPGDVLLTGTPAGVGPLTAGCEVAVTVEGVGTLRNPVAART